MCLLPIPILFFFNDTATTEIYTLSLHDALPIYVYRAALSQLGRGVLVVHGLQDRVIPLAHARQVAEGLGVAQPRWLDRCGHFPQIEHAEVVNTYLRDFLFAPASR